MEKISPFSFLPLDITTSILHLGRNRRVELGRLLVVHQAHAGVRHGRKDVFHGRRQRHLPVVQAKLGLGIYLFVAGKWAGGKVEQKRFEQIFMKCAFEKESRINEGVATKHGVHSNSSAYSLKRHETLCETPLISLFFSPLPSPISTLIHLFTPLSILKSHLYLGRSTRSALVQVCGSDGACDAVHVCHQMAAKDGAV